MPYISDAEAKTYARSEIAADDPLVTLCRTTAEQDINNWCQRDFNVPTSASLRAFAPQFGSSLLKVPDIANTTGLIVSNDGSTLTLGVDFQLETTLGQTSQTAITGEQRPYSWVRLLDHDWWEFDGDRATVSITARWGWPATPSAVTLCARILTRDYLKSRDIYNGIATFGADGFTRRIGANPTVVELLAPYRAVEARGMA